MEACLLRGQQDSLHYLTQKYDKTFRKQNHYTTVTILIQQDLAIHEQENLQGRQK